MSSYFFLSVLCVQTLSELRKAFRALNPNSLYQECKCVCDCVTRQGLETSAGSTIRVARWTAAGVRAISGQLMELSLALSGHNITAFQSLKTWAYGFRDFFFYGMVLCIMLDKPRWRYLAGKQVDESICTNWLEFINKLVLYLIKTELLAWSGQEEKPNLIVVPWSAWGAPFICTLSVNSLFLFTAPLTLCCMAKLPARPLSEAMSPHHVCPSGL